MYDATALPAAPAARQAQRGALFPLAVRDLTLHFGETAVLDELSLDLGPSGCTMIMGPNGAGKSLFLKLLHGLMQPTSGRIDWGGVPTAQATARQALVFQKPVLLRRSV
ncbi:ATP-binding cassette domain-containing protein, partial [Cribrihabitans sp. XS_ASV171]